MGVDGHLFAPALMMPGQSADRVNAVGGLPTLDAVLGVARRTSGDYTVRRSLEFGPAVAASGAGQAA